MEINIRPHEKYKTQSELPPASFHNDGRIGFWGHVTQLHSDSLTVDIEGDNGFEYQFIPVISKEWVNADNKTGARDLPPEGSSVFVITPTKTIQGAFVLCSGFAKTQPAESAEFVAASSSQTDVEKGNNSIKTRSTSGWITEQNRENGNITITESDNENIKIEIVTTDDTTKGVKKEVTINAWNNTITLNADGISIESAKNVTLKTNGDLTFDASGKNVDFQCSKFTVNKTVAGTSDFSVG